MLSEALKRVTAINTRTHFLDSQNETSHGFFVLQFPQIARFSTAHKSLEIKVLCQRIVLRTSRRTLLCVNEILAASCS